MKTGLYLAVLILSGQMLATQALWYEVAGAVAGVSAVTVGAPVVLGVLGFGAGGIAAGSLAAKAMSVAATTGYGMGAVAVAQSVGAAGVSVATGVTGALAGTGAARLVKTVLRK